ncbi:MAG: adenine-specific methyltransferase EcoRI family protein [Bacteroidales bacterium]|nr:adenine-specific methyltransferase EcoRI family protein [Bacteroidales bacterium]
MSNKNTNLHRAKRCKDDEFYTTYETVLDELSYYKEQFKDKIVLCNCDDPFKSNFCKYFLDNFNMLGLKRLICTSYTPWEPVQTDETGKLTISFQPNFGKILDITEVNEDFDLNSSVKELKGNGDFRSKECVEYLKICDIVVTNPPFSLFKKLFMLIMQYKKQFLIIGNQNALTYKEIFPLVQNNQVWTGYQFGEMKFRVPADSEPRSTRYWVDETGQKWRSLGNAMWLTNLDNERRHETLKLIQKFNPEIHPKYDNYDAIHVRNVTEIPFDYKGIMGVPITIINRYNSEQFEIVGEANHGSDSEFDIFKPTINGKETFKRILIRNRYAS